jgi:hypothetical protein
MKARKRTKEEERGGRGKGERKVNLIRFEQVLVNHFTAIDCAEQIHQCLGLLSDHLLQHFPVVARIEDSQIYVATVESIRGERGEREGLRGIERGEGWEGLKMSPKKQKQKKKEGGLHVS